MHPSLSRERKQSVQPKASLAKQWVKMELEWMRQKIVNMKSNDEEHNDVNEKGKSTQVTEEELELEISSVQQFSPTASGPNRNINPTTQREYNTSG
jgi:hypothetical protein